jgi:hypothetical protein
MTSCSAVTAAERVGNDALVGVGHSAGCRHQFPARPAVGCICRNLPIKVLALAPCRMVMSGRGQSFCHGNPVTKSGQCHQTGSRITDLGYTFGYTLGPSGTPSGTPWGYGSLGERLLVEPLRRLRPRSHHPSPVTSAGAQRTHVPAASRTLSLPADSDIAPQVSVVARYPSTVTALRSAIRTV